MRTGADVSRRSSLQGSLAVVGGDDAKALPFEVVPQGGDQGPLVVDNEYGCHTLLGETL
jgi:hypothetical protein